MLLLRSFEQTCITTAVEEPCLLGLVDLRTHLGATAVTLQLRKDRKQRVHKAAQGNTHPSPNRIGAKLGITIGSIYINLH